MNKSAPLNYMLFVAAILASLAAFLLIAAPKAEAMLINSSNIPANQQAHNNSNLGLCRDGPGSTIYKHGQKNWISLRNQPTNISPIIMNYGSTSAINMQLNVLAHHCRDNMLSASRGGPPVPHPLPSDARIQNTSIQYTRARVTGTSASAGSVTGLAAGATATLNYTQTYYGGAFDTWDLFYIKQPWPSDNIINENAHPVNLRFSLSNLQNLPPGTHDIVVRISARWVNQYTGNRFLCVVAGSHADTFDLNDSANRCSAITSTATVRVVVQGFSINIDRDCSPTPRVRFRANPLPGQGTSNYNARLLRNGSDTTMLKEGVAGGVYHTFDIPYSWVTSSQNFSVRVFDNVNRQTSVSTQVSLGPCIPPPTATCTISTTPGGGMEVGERFTTSVTINNTGSSSIASSSYPLSYTWPSGLSSGTRPTTYTTIPAGGTRTVDIPSVYSDNPGTYLVTARVGSLTSCTRSIPIGTKPYLKTFGGEVMAGGNFGSTNCTPPAGRGGIHAWGETRSVGNGSARRDEYVGASAQLTVSSLLRVNEFYSSSLGPSPRPKGLTFANAGSADANSTYGGGSGLGRCITDYFNDTRDPSLDQGAWPGGLPGNAGRVQYSSNGLTINGLTVPTGTQAAVYINGDVYISSNITYASGATSWDNHPYLVVIASGDIRIAPGVTRLDGLFIAQGGTLYTCAPGVNSNYTAANVYASCGNPLTVNGGLLGSDIRFLRMNGSLRDATANEDHTSPSVAELIRYTPEMYLAPSPLSQPDTTNTFSRYHSIRSLPPVF